MNDRLTTLLHDQAARLDVRLAGPGQLRRAAQRKRTVRRSAAAALAVSAVVIVALIAWSDPLSGAKHHTVPVEPPVHPTQFAILPPVGTPVSLPADGRLVLNIDPHSGSWNVYADGRIIGGSGQQRLTPHGVQLLVSRILTIGNGVGLFRQNQGLVNPAYDAGGDVDWYQVCNNGLLVNAQVLPTGITNDPAITVAQMHALAQIDEIAADPSSVLPASAWADRTIRPYVNATYQLVFDRHAPDPSQLPSPAREALAQYQPLLHNADQTISSDQARALLAAFAEARVKVVRNDSDEADFDLPAADGARTILEVRPADPSSALTDSDRC